eukprot:TRINITY_DN9972_c0_g1_i1.p1 TRINITY_DN9972_c0_g1~~TRINITY_DN9972_c0_g1_i1.p1  ORF type:complete len:270 (+),score=92.22 TRINITY_DN9972_c0_g1_i1:52-861(+)
MVQGYLYECLYDIIPEEDAEINLKQGERIYATEIANEEDWLNVVTVLTPYRNGYAPGAYLSLIRNNVTLPDEIIPLFQHSDSGIIEQDDYKMDTPNEKFSAMVDYSLMEQTENLGTLAIENDENEEEEYDDEEQNESTEDNEENLFSSHYHQPSNLSIGQTGSINNMSYSLPNKPFDMMMQMDTNSPYQFSNSVKLSTINKNKQKSDFQKNLEMSLTTVDQRLENVKMTAVSLDDEMDRFNAEMNGFFAELTKFNDLLLNTNEASFLEA